MRCRRRQAVTGGFCLSGPLREIESLHRLRRCHLPLGGRLCRAGACPRRKGPLVKGGSRRSRVGENSSAPSRPLLRPGPAQRPAPTRAPSHKAELHTLLHVCIHLMEKRAQCAHLRKKNSSGAAPWSCLKVMDGYGVDSDSRIRYPTPTSVKMYSGFAGFFSSFLRIFASTARRFWVLSETFAPQISRRRKS